MYSRGYDGVPIDYVEAALWYKKAADQGVVEAQETLGDLYRLGVGIDKDVVQAYKWYQISISDNTELPDYKKNEITGTIGLLEKEMTNDQVAEAKKLANEWKPMAK